jgi:hypothetical protein
VTDVVHIIASCTERKRLPVPKRLRLRHIRSRSIEARAATWWAQLQEYSGAKVPALDLYAGDHWAIVRDLPRVAERSNLVARVWVASAGYGLFPACAAVQAYSATFSPDSLDSVFLPGALNRTQASAWWQAINSESGPDPTAPRSVATLAAGSPKASIVVVASANYIAAMKDDLVATRKRLESPGRLIVVSGRSSLSGGDLAEHWIPSEAVLLASVGGARGSLHARVARKILEEAPKWELDARTLRERYARLISRAPDLERHNREPMTDSAVGRYITRAIAQDQSVPHTRLLRQLRASGRACEQKRFRRLYFQVMEERGTWVERA